MKRFCALLVMVFLTGCSSSVSIQGWQSELETYIANQENGDASFLRDPAGESRHKRFAVLGASSPDKSSDVAGVLVGRPEFQGKHWLVFLVAAVKQREVQDIRVAMVSDDGPKRQWIWSEENSNALTSYRKFHESRWRRLDAVRTDAPIDAGLFPPDDDVYQFGSAGNTAWVTERNSGSRWTMVMSSGKE